MIFIGLDLCTATREPPRILDIKGRVCKIKEWGGIGDAGGLSAAGRRIVEMEGDSYPICFLRFYVDSVTESTGATDAELMSRIEYQHKNHCYLLTRSIQQS